MININSHNGFHPLKTCLVGQCYPPEFFSFIKDSRLRNIFERIAIETEEDYQKLIKILESHQVQCLRPKFSEDWGMYLVPHESGVERYLRPPMQPRDDMIAIGNRLFVVHLQYGDGYIDPWDWVIDQIEPSQLFDFRDVSAWKKIAPPCITRLGNDLYFDFFSRDKNYSRQQFFNLFQNHMLPMYFQDYRVHFVDKGGHSDAVFSPVVPGLLVTYESPDLYKNTFPGWEIITVDQRELEQNDIALKALKATKGSWWIPGYEFDNDLVDFVESNFQGWVGYAIETYFDVNLLMIDEKNAIINSGNEKILAALEARGIKAHECAFRHRYFWDCGLHCATLDLFREGEKLDYFPHTT